LGSKNRMSFLFARVDNLKGAGESATGTPMKSTVEPAGQTHRRAHQAVKRPRVHLRPKDLEEALFRSGKSTLRSVLARRILNDFREIG
jgi:hypothetical protein